MAPCSHLLCRSADRRSRPVIAGRRVLLLVLLCGMLFGVNGHAANRVALVIGNAAYAQSPLDNPVNDARAVAARLEGLGFDVLVVTDADRRAMEAALVAFNGRLDADATALFYYAGHGVQSNGRNYLLPVDATVSSLTALRFEALEMGDILEEIGLAGPRVSIVVLDACRNNPFERKVRGGGRGLAAIDAARGTLIAYATAPGSVAIDGQGRHGLYTAAFLDALQVPGLKAEEVFKRVRIAVAERSGGQQVPWESSSLTGDFVFNGDPVPPAALPGPESPPALPGPGLEQSLWESAREIDSADAYAAYLAQFPQGTFAGMARLRMQGDGRTLDRSPATQCAMQGAWRQYVPSSGCRSQLHFASRADGGYDVTEEGCFGSVGEARFSGDMLLVDWRIGVVCAGRTELHFAADCDSAQGEVVMPPGGWFGCSGRHASTLHRVQ